MISQELQAIYAGSNKHRILDTLEFSHPNFSAVHYLVNDFHDWYFRLTHSPKPNIKSTRFIAMPFQVELPGKDLAGRQELQIVVSNVGRVLSDELERAAVNTHDPILCIYRAYFDVQDSAPQIAPDLTLSITDVTVTENVVSATASRFDVLNETFPNRFFTADLFPGLRR